MGHAHGDPDTIRDFARALEQFSQEASESLSRIQGRLEDLGQSSWKDDNQRRFREQFSTATQRIQAILEDLSPGHTSQLIQLAQRYEDILS